MGMREQCRGAVKAGSEGAMAVLKFLDFIRNSEGEGGEVRNGE